MTDEPLIDLDPEPATRERRWPFYVAWTIGGAMLGAVLLAHLPATPAYPAAIAPAPVPTSAPTAEQKIAPPIIQLPRSTGPRLQGPPIVVVPRPASIP
jgi:hypothetical protein